MGKFGKKNEIKIDPLRYNMVLLGEPKIGKTSIIKEFCESVGGKDSYIFLELAGEAGADAINGIIYEDVNDWDGLLDIIEDIEDNKSTDYPDLRAIVIDTYDGWIQLAEEEAIRTWKNLHPEKDCDSIDAAWNGFQKGQKKAFEYMYDIVRRLKAINIATIIIGHVKNKERDDVASGIKYTTLTSDVDNVYFNLLKKKMHFMGLAYYDRTIVTEKTGRKNPVTHKEMTINKIKSESRKIKWRDDNYAIDSGARFADIVPETEFSCEAMVKAITDAIKAEAEKSGKTATELKDKQDKEVEKREKEIAAEEQTRREEKAELKKIIRDSIDVFITLDSEEQREVMTWVKNLGYENPTKIDSLDDAKKFKDVLEKYNS